MKIMHMCLAAFYIDNYSYQENILPRMHKKLGHDVMILASTETFVDGVNLGYIQPSNYINEDGIPVHRIPYALNKFGFLAKKLRRYLGVYQEIENFAPDLLFLHDVQFLSISDVVKYVRCHPHVKIIADGHADFSNSARTFLSKNVLHKIIYKHCAQSILPYTTMYYGTLPARVEFFKTVYGIPAEKVSFLPMGVDDDLADKYSDLSTRAHIRMELGINDNDFVIVTGGKIDLAKTQTLLLMQAVQSIENPNVKMLVFGSVAQELQERFNSLCSEKIRYLGWATVDESYKYLSIADIVVFPGRHSVYWEQAAGLGKPLVVKHWEGTTHVDLDGNVAFLYDDSVEEIKSKLEQIINEPKTFQQMKRVALEKGVETFSYKKIAQRCIQIETTKGE